MTTERAWATELASIIRRDRARRSRAKRFGKFLADFLGGQIALALTALVNGWMLMLAVAVAHEHWITQLPTIGYWWAALITWLLQRGTGAAAKKDGAL